MSRAAVLFVLSAALAGCGKSETSPSPPSAPYSQIDLVAGTGAVAESGRTVTVSYTLWLYDPGRPEGKGTQIQQLAGYRFVLGVGAVIQGWDRGVPGMQVGGQRRLVVPPDLAYGNRSPEGIPANATLVFDITLTAVQ